LQYFRGGTVLVSYIAGAVVAGFIVGWKLSNNLFVR
jgi:hypothetical protein